VIKTPRTRLGVGLVFRKIGRGVDIYDRTLTVAEVRRRIETCWQPYHDALKEALDAAHGRDGMVFHLNCHSMEPVGNELSPDPGVTRPHFVLGDLDGRSCAPGFTAFVADTLQDLGYTVALNDPYKGAELVASYGDPKVDRHSLQIEVNRSLYMDRKTRVKHDGFEPLKRDLGRMLARLCDYAREQSRLATARSGS
jgi:N-formylglutamate deformylase